MRREKNQDRLDYVLLGMGGDGHTASLFPGNPALAEKNHLVRKIHYDKVDPPDRVTMTFPLINAVRVVGVFVTGKSKAAMISRIATGSETVEQIPIKGVNPRYGELKWYLDAEAAGAETDAV